MSAKNWGRTPEWEARYANIQRKYKYKCTHCGWLTVIYPFEKKYKKVCRNCGHYVYDSPRNEFKDRLKEVMK